MKIKVKLTGTLKEYAPPDGLLEVPEKATIGDALILLGIVNQTQAVVLNLKIHPDRDTVLKEGDELTVLGAVGGG